VGVGDACDGRWLTVEDWGGDVGGGRWMSSDGCCRVMCVVAGVVRASCCPSRKE